MSDAVQQAEPWLLGGRFSARYLRMSSGVAGGFFRRAAIHQRVPDSTRIQVYEVLDKLVGMLGLDAVRLASGLGKVI